MIHVLSCAFPALPPVCKYRFFSLVDKHSYFGKNGRSSLTLKLSSELRRSIKKDGHYQNYHCFFADEASEVGNE